ncbi:MAG: universal stress protein [Ignavibacteriaceae bacterium]
MSDKFFLKRLLVPLDGSTLAESVLPAAAYLARKLNISVTLTHIIEKDAPEKVHGQRHLKLPKQAEEYLNSIAVLDLFNGIKVEIHVHEEKVKDVPKSIADHIKELNQDIVLLCAHGNVRLHGMLFGSVAQQVISRGNTPVLLINPSDENITFEYHFKNFLVPLDGNPDHEQALDYASGLAKLCEANIHLVMAIPNFGTMSGEVSPANLFLPGTTTRMMDMLVPDAEEYLEKLKSKYEQSELIITTSASRNDPANAIIDTAKIINSDLIVLATHGTKGAEAFWEGSITPKISKSSKTPLLLVPVYK